MDEITRLFGNLIIVLLAQQISFSSTATVLYSNSASSVNLNLGAKFPMRVGKLLLVTLEVFIGPLALCVERRKFGVESKNATAVLFTQGKQVHVCLANLKMTDFF